MWPPPVFLKDKSHRMNSFKDKLPPMGTLGPLIALVLACVFFASQSDRFLSTQNFSLILAQVMVVGVIAIGQTLIILTAGIDLSCGMVMALGGIVMTKFAADYGLSTPVAMACGLLVTTAFGYLNGVLVTRIKLPPFIVTLGTLNIAFAITQLYSGSQTVTDIPDGMNWLGSTFSMGGATVSYGVVMMLGLCLFRLLHLLTSSILFLWVRLPIPPPDYIIEGESLLRFVSLVHLPGHRRLYPGCGFRLPSILNLISR